MFDNVLVGVDGRIGGRDAIALGARLAAPEARITLASVYAGPFNPLHAVKPGAIDDERTDTEALLEREREQADVKAELQAVEAVSPGQGLHELAERLGADLLVLGTCHHGTIGRVVLGNDTRAALLGAPCAVAIAPAGYGAEASAPTSIGVGYDESPEAVRALAAARELGERYGARVKALQIVSYPTYVFTGIIPPVGAGLEELVQHADERMKALPGVEGSAEYGLSGQDLAALSKEVDLLVVGSRNYGPARTLIAGSTASFLQSHSRCPLLILPRGTSVASSEDVGDSEGEVVASR